MNSRLLALATVFALLFCVKVFAQVTGGNVYLPLISSGSSGVLPTQTPTPTFVATLPAATFTRTPSPTSTNTIVPPTNTSTPTSTPVPPTNTPIPDGAVEILSSTTFYPAYNVSRDIYLVGEVINHTSKNVEFVKINATLRNSNGDIIDGQYTYTQVDTLAPGMKSGFRLSFSNPPLNTTYDTFVTWDTASKAPYELPITNLQTYFDSSNAFHVQGIVTNPSAVKHQFIKISITLYNAANQVIGVDYHYLNPTDLDPNQHVPFDADVYFWRAKPDKSQVDHYTVHAYDD